MTIAEEKPVDKTEQLVRFIEETARKVSKSGELLETKAILAGVTISMILTAVLVLCLHIQYITGMGALLFMLGYGISKYLLLQGENKCQQTKP